MIALPANEGGANIHSGIMAGEVNGVIAANTAKGWRM